MAEIGARSRPRRARPPPGPSAAKPPAKIEEDQWAESATLAPGVRIRLKEKGAAKAWRAAPLRDTSSLSDLSGERKNMPRLRHWVTAGAPDYGVFDRKLDVLMYTDEEYEQYLQEPTWTREQTDRFFEMCSRFSLRFMAIHDRFSCPGPADPEGTERLGLEAREISRESEVILSKDKSMEDLKDRYYSIQKTLLATRNSSDPELQRHLLFAANFDPEYETRRKEQLARLLLRTKEQVAAMAELVLEHRRLTHGIKSLKKEQKKGKSTKGGPRRSFAGCGAAPIPEHCIAKDVFKERHPGCFLRSTQMSTQVQVTGRNTSKQLELELNNLGFKQPKPFPVASGRVCDMYDKLRTDLVTFINLQAHLRKKEEERDTIKLQLQHAPSEVAPTGIKKKEKRRLDDAAPSKFDKKRRIG